MKPTQNNWLKTEALKICQDIHQDDNALIAVKKVWDKYANKKDFRKPFIGITESPHEQILLAAGVIYYQGAEPQPYSIFGVRAPGYQCC